MDSVDLDRVKSSLRRRYEWRRARNAVVGFAPSVLVIIVAALMSKRPATALAFGAMMFVSGVLLLWYGRDARRAVLPGFAAGVVPLAFALCANHFGHACVGDRCIMLCMPACTVGGLVAGYAVAHVAQRSRHGIAFWAAASGLALFTGAMGCSCIGFGGVLGLGAGYVVGAIPTLVRRVWALRS